jgi:hypothetical protein
MHRIQRVRIVLAALLLMASTGLPAWGEELRSREEARPARLAALARSAAALFWSRLTGLWEKAGCILDPNGGCAAGQSTAETDEGCGLDPNGGCAAGQSTAETEAGCGIDPHGGCAAGR